MLRFDPQRTRARKSAGIALAGLAACTLLVGCGNLTAGGLTGEATVTVSGDTPDAIPAPLRAVALSETRPMTVSGGGPEGEVRASFFLYLETAAGDLVALSEDEIEVRVDVEGRQDVDAIDRTTVPAALYTQMRIVFTDIRVEVSNGLIINGVPVLGEVKVRLEDVALTVTRPLNLNIGDGDSVFLLVDLNANTWLQAVDPVLLEIAEEVFADAVAVDVL